jgi:hypothetical protein
MNEGQVNEMYHEPATVLRSVKRDLTDLRDWLILAKRESMSLARTSPSHAGTRTNTAKAVAFADALERVQFILHTVEVGLGHPSQPVVVDFVASEREATHAGV